MQFYVHVFRTKENGRKESINLPSKNYTEAKALAEGLAAYLGKRVTVLVYINVINKDGFLLDVCVDDILSISDKIREG